MITVRNNTFETNSSSTHALCLGLKSEYEEWRKGNLFLNRMSEYEKKRYNNETASKQFVTFDEMISLLEQSDWFNKEILAEIKSNPDLLKDYIFDIGDASFYTEESFYNLGYSDETFFQSFTTPSGDEVVAFGYSGYDG